MKSNQPSGSSQADPSNDRSPLASSASAAPGTEAGANLIGRPKPLSVEAAEALHVDPFWVPPGLELEGWSPALRNEIAALINPIYNELVLLARPGLAQSTGLTIVHLIWLEILDQIELARIQTTPDLSKDPLQIVSLVSGRESRAQRIERHLRLVHAKLKASDLLLRLNQFKSRSRLQRKSQRDDHRSSLSAVRRRIRNPGKNDFC